MANNSYQGKYSGKSAARGIRRIPLSVWLAYLLVATMVMTGVTVSGYVSTTTSSDTARVAVMASDMKVTVDQVMIAPGEAATFEVVVANYIDNDTICEVAQQYTIQDIRPLSENIPDMDYYIYADKDCTTLAQTTGTLKAGEKDEKHFWVKAIWPGSNNSASLAFEIDAIELTVTAEQID